MEQQYDRNTNTITVCLDGEKMNTMYHNDLVVYWTPGASNVYIASQPSWRDDRSIATVSDLADALGYDVGDFADDDVLTVTLDLDSGAVTMV